MHSITVIANTMDPCHYKITHNTTFAKQIDFRTIDAATCAGVCRATGVVIVSGKIVNIAGEWDGVIVGEREG